MFEEWQKMEPLDYAGEAAQALVTAKRHFAESNYREALGIACLALNRAAHAIEQNLLYKEGPVSQGKAQAVLALAEALAKALAPDELKDNCQRCGREIPYDGRDKPICRPCVEELEEENSLLSKTYAAHDPRRAEAYNAGVEAGKAGWPGPRLPEEKELREFWYEGYEEGIRLRGD